MDPGRSPSPCRLVSLLLLSSLLPACAGAGGAVRAGRGALPAGVDVAVERVVDGDTIVVRPKRRVRLLGVDTPETTDPRRPVECFGREASAFLSSILPRGSAVRLVGDVEQRDAYGRTLAYVYRLPDALFVNAELVRRGYAQVLTMPPNLTHAEEFRALAAEAREASRGLWSSCPASDGHGGAGR